MNEIIEAIKASLQSQIVSGGLVLMFTGSVIALCRRIPLRIWYWLRRRFTIEVDVGNDDPLFEWLSVWLSEQPYSRRARNLTATTRRDMYGNIAPPEQAATSASSPRESALPQIIFTPAPGNHLFLYRRRLVWLTRDRQTAGGDGKDNGFWSKWKRETFNIRVVGRDQQTARALLEDARAIAHKDTKPTIDIFVSSRGYWNKADSKEPRPLSTVFLPDSKAETVARDAAEFLQNREWYRQRGIPYRRGYLFYGIPGSGKTSLIGALSGELKMNLYILNVGGSELTDDGLYELMAQVPPRSMLLLEDIDAAFNQRQKESQADNGVTFSGLLNALDGAASKEGCLVFMTTNHLDRLDPALIRPGRADFHVSFDYATAEQAERMYAVFYPNAPALNAKEFGKMVGNTAMSMAEVQQHLLNNKDSAQSALLSFEGVEEIAQR